MIRTKVHFNTFFYERFRLYPLTIDLHVLTLSQKIYLTYPTKSEYGEQNQEVDQLNGFLGKGFTLINNYR